MAVVHVKGSMPKRTSNPFQDVYAYIEDFLGLFFPSLCAGCQKSLFKNEQIICTDCIYHLPYTNFHLDPDNRAARQLWGRVPFIACSSFLYFQKGSRVQNLMHQLKYNNRPEVAEKLGEMYGNTLHKSGKPADIDLIIPVPLHSRRFKERGYNQSAYFAQGLSRAMEIPVNNNILSRSIATVTQTKRSRFSRYENMKDVFQVSFPELVTGKHILLVDDVITTGATLEACGMKLLEVTGTRLSIATIAFTR